jgi:4-amino-4-deoxy-L-arabinose transferase-like glycosyltransferase
VVLSVVVPARDEAPNLERLVTELRLALEPIALPWELVVVDDASLDGTPAVLAALAASDPRIRSVRLDRPSGQTRALFAGFAASSGEYIATLDADLQCAPTDLAPLLAAMTDADLACGIRTRRHDPRSRRIASALSNLARRLLVAPAVRDLACPLRVFRRAALSEVERLAPEFDGAHRWLPALFVLAGLRVVQRPVSHRPRTAGVSKYTTRGRAVPVLRELGRVLALRVRLSPYLPVAFLTLAALVFLWGLGTWPLMEPDEGRNAEVAREMLQTGHWSVPQFNGLPYLDKPVVLFWMIAAAFQIAGVGEAAARLPSVLGALATVALTFDLSRILMGRRRALVAATVLATMPIVFVYARLVIFDMPLTALVTGALYCLVRARVEGNAWRWLPLAGLAMGLATLTKGPVGIAVPLIAWVAARGALPTTPERGSRLGPVLAATAVLGLVVVPWLAIVAQQEPGFLRYAFLDETVLRLLRPERFHRSGPVYFYIVTLAWALGVWGVVLAALTPSLARRYRAGGGDTSTIAFAVRATTAIVVFFTLSASKRPHYILPALVPLAMLVAIAATAEPGRATSAVRGLARWVALAGVAMIVAVAAGFEGRAGEFRVLLPGVLTGAGLFLAGWGVATAVGARRPALALACCALFTPGLGLTLLGPLTPYAEGRSSRMLASHIEPAAPVFCFDTFRTSLPFYLGRPVVLASDSGRALTSNYVLARRGSLDTVHLVPIRSLRSLLDGDGHPFIVASLLNAGRLTRLSPRPLLPTYTDRSSILFEQKG